MNTFRGRLTMGFSLILIAFAVAIFAYELPRERAHKRAITEAQLDSYAMLVSQLPQEEYMLANLLHDSLRLTVINSEGQVLYDNQTARAAKENHRNRPEIQQARREGTGSDIRRSATNGQEYLYYARKFEEGSNTLFIRVAEPYNNHVRDLLRPDASFFYALMLFLLIGIVFIYYVSIYFSKTIVQARKASQQRQRQELTSNIAHELRTPVTGIRGYLETILEQPMSNEQRDSFIQKAHRQTVLLSNLISDISLLTKVVDAPHSFSMQPVNLSECINEVMDTFSSRLKEHDITVISTIPEQLQVRCNANLLAAVFQNLTENVLKYAGEHIAVSIREVHRTATHAYISYSDTGTGIKDEEQFSRLFERFYRIESGRTRQAGGTGLGLAIVKNIITFHTGTITAQNLSSGGLEFLFSLPLA